MPRDKDRANILKGSGDMILNLVCKRATPKQWAEWLRTPLEHAAGTGEHDLVAKLLEAGANGSAGRRSPKGTTLLHAAAEGGSEQVVTALIGVSDGGDLNSVTQPVGQTPLHVAAGLGKEAAGRALIMAGADVNIQDANNELPLHLALKRCHTQLAEDLLLGGSDPNARDSTRAYPIHLAARRGQDGVVGALIQKRVDLDGLDANNKTPLSLAVAGAHVSTVKKLLAGGADPNFRMGAGSTALHWAAGELDRGIAISALVEAGADLEARTTRNETPLRWASRCAMGSSLRALLQLGADVNTRCHGRLTPLHMACACGRADAADLLLRAGADEKARCMAGRTAVSVVPAVATAAAGDRPRLERLLKLLKRAPQDRAWRRRGFLVVCRAHPDRAQLLADGLDASPEALDQRLERQRRRPRGGQWDASSNGLSGVRGGGGGGGAGWNLGAG
ncbi:unnamed protein product, partial [Scytosiphon promiscuus]